jgi:hypothetical protein
LARLHIVVEGQTEETFVRDILAPTLGERSVFADVHRVTTGRKGSTIFRGGLRRYEHLRRDLTLWMKQDQGSDAWFTTMIDLYALPHDSPGYQESQSITDPVQRVQFLETGLAADLCHARFLPYIQLHEFEALLFSDANCLSDAFPEEVHAIAALVHIRESAPSPEHINDGVETAPSKRICAALPQYTKAVHGPIIAKHIGLPKLRRECPHFNRWIELLLDLDTRAARPGDSR